MNRSPRVPPSHAKRRSDATAWPSGVCASRTSPSIAYGTPSVPSAVSSGARQRSTDGHDDPDPLRRRSRAQQREQLLADELERAARTGALEEADRAVARDRRRRLVAEQRALEMRERGMRELGPARRQLVDVTRRETREIVGGAAKRRERGTARLVRQRHADLGARRERLEQRPLGAGQILEAVREDRLAVPRVEIRLEALGGAAAHQVAIPERQPVELRAVRAVELGEVAVELLRVEQPRLELADGLEQRVGEAAEPRRRGEAVQPRARECAAHEQRALRRRHERPLVAGDPLEDVVERSDRAAEERRPPREKIALDAIDVRSVRHDQDRLALERGQIAVEQQLDLARVRRPGDQAESHVSIVDRGADGSPGPGRPRPQSAGKRCARVAAWPASPSRATVSSSICPPSSGSAAWSAATSPSR